ncbi:hypothetical protein ACFVFI_37525, partial [Streptomyces sp. NPDC057705]|uniref:hypothetical protein n=1 Tax=Streptomyces sp. NPDC057705 TaxID=3346222 RepID=UPI0036BDDD22
MNTPPRLPVPLAARPLGPPWWVAPALFSAVALSGGAWGYHSSPIVHGSVWLVLPYALPVALVAASWWPPSSLGARTRSLVLGGLGALVALAHAHLAPFVRSELSLVLRASRGSVGLRCG